MEPWLKL